VAVPIDLNGDLYNS